MDWSVDPARSEGLGLTALTGHFALLLPVLKESFPPFAPLATTEMSVKWGTHGLRPQHTVGGWRHGGQVPSVDLRLTLLKLRGAIFICHSTGRHSPDPVHSANQASVLQGIFCSSLFIAFSLMLLKSVDDYSSMRPLRRSAQVDNDGYSCALSVPVPLVPVVDPSAQVGDVVNIPRGMRIRFRDKLIKQYLHVNSRCQKYSLTRT